MRAGEWTDVLGCDANRATNLAVAGQGKEIPRRAPIPID
jgi:hypothetical protein